MMRLLVQITKNDLLSLFRNAPYWSQTPYLLFCVGLLISPLSTHAQVNECSIVEVTQLTISQDPIIKQQLLQVEAQKANFQTARSIFDRTVTSDLTWMRARRSPLLVEDASTIYSLNKVINTDWIYQAGISQLFESGLVVSPNLAFSRNSTSFPEDDFGNSQPNGSASNFFVLGLNATQPLLRGRGESITTANQRANQYQIETVDEVSRFTATTQVYSTAIAYWEYVAATKSLEIFKANENRTRRILEVTEILVEAQRKPAADTTQIQADVAEKTTLRINAEQQLFATRQNLGRTIGLEAEEAVLLPLPQDDFPNVNTSGVNGQSASLNDLIDLALVNRHDLKALSHQTTTNTIIRDAAEHNLQPQLDAQLSLGYGGRQDGKGVGQIFTPIYQNEGRNFALGATLSYTFPLENNAA
ncbi:MAG: TolC family protein, partial [Chitinophagales bacterium]